MKINTFFGFLENISHPTWKASAYHRLENLGPRLLAKSLYSGTSRYEFNSFRDLLLVRQFARISKQFFPLELNEMPLVRSSPQNASQLLFYVFLNKKNVVTKDKFCIKT